MLRWLIVALCCQAPAEAYWQSRAQVSISVAAGYTGPGDVVSGATAWWGVRAYSASYASGLGILARVCTVADAVCANVSSDANGNFDLAGAATLTCTNISVCTINKLVDQTGNGNDILTSLEANRPTLVVPGAANGCPSTSDYCVKFNGTTSRLTSAALTVAQSLTLSAVAVRTSGSSYSHIIGKSNGDKTLHFGPDATHVELFWVADHGSLTQTNGTWYALHAVNSATASQSFVYRDTTASTGFTLTTGYASDLIAMGFDTGETLTGSVVEAGIWPVAFSSGQVSSMSSNQHSYWGF